MKTVTYLQKIPVAPAGRSGSLRLILAIVGGVVTAFALVAATEALFHSMSPTSAAPADMSDREAMRAYVASQPLGVLVTVLAGWTAAVFAGAAVAARFGGRGPWPGGLVAGLFLLAIASNFLMIPHPAWMVTSAIAMIATAGWFGSRVGAAGVTGRP